MPRPSRVGIDRALVSSTSGDLGGATAAISAIVCSNVRKADFQALGSGIHLVGYSSSKGVLLVPAFFFPFGSTETDWHGGYSLISISIVNNKSLAHGCLALLFRRYSF